MVLQCNAHVVADLGAALPARGAELDSKHRKAAGEEHESAPVVDAPARCVRNDGSSIYIEAGWGPEKREQNF
jgi:hypothetical protein